MFLNFVISLSIDKMFAKFTYFLQKIEKFSMERR